MRMNGAYPGGGRSGSSSKQPRLPGPGIRPPGASVGTVDASAASSSMISSELESSVFDSEDVQSMASSRFTTSTDHTSVSQQMLKNRNKKRSKRRGNVPPHLARAGSFSSVTDSTMSLNCITVTLNMDTVSFLGISIVGQSNKFGDGGDCGIYVGSIMKGGAVALDGRIEPGDMILQVNDINFENMSNDDAVRVLRDVVQKPGPIKLVVAKCWDPNPKDYFSVPRTEPVRPIDPGAWVEHTRAVRGLEIPQYPGAGAGAGGLRAPSVSTLTSSSPSLASTVQERSVAPVDRQLTIQSGMKTICSVMQRQDSGLEVRDRMWLKINIPAAFIGADVVNWLFTNVTGFSDKREAKKYASQMLKAGFIKHTVNKSSFSEQCYYTFGDIASALQSCNIKDNSDGSETDRDTLGPLPPMPTPGVPPPLPHLPQQWPTYQQTYANPPNLGPIYNPAPPPSTYMTFGAPPPNNHSGHSDSSNGSIRHTLAASGSGSESDTVGANIANLSISSFPKNIQGVTS